jgi:hypothetical protein
MDMAQDEMFEELMRALQEPWRHPDPADGPDGLPDD